MRGLPNNVKSALEKSRDSALLAVEIYNKPAVKFKSGGFVSLMVIAWTALFHAVFLKRKIKPFYRKKNGVHFVKVDGDPKHWELDECLRQYFKEDTGNPVRKNLEFFIPLRNKVEHRSMPELDANIFGECQAMLLNFDDMLEKEFAAKYRIRESLSFSLQLFPSSEGLVEAAKRSPSEEATVAFIKQFRSSISPEQWASSQYSFKAFLIQVANHANKDALPIKFLSYDKLSATEKKQVSRLVAMTKVRQVSVANLDTFKPTDVVEQVQAQLGDPKIVRITPRGTERVDKFSVNVHTNCWKRYGVRPPGGSPKPEQTVTKYCIYDKRHNDYGYTRAWVDFLVDKLSDEAEFEAVRDGQLLLARSRRPARGKSQ